MDPLRGDVFSPADGDYYGQRLRRRCNACQHETREAKLARLFVGFLAGYVFAVVVWQVLGEPLPW